MEAIDAVITWVDGVRPKATKQSIESTLAGRTDIKKQYLHSNEISFCVASILKYAPFIRKVFIVTDCQSPNLR